jgi:DNA-binding XRE family transcriptional regulator
MTISLGRRTLMTAEKAPRAAKAAIAAARQRAELIRQKLAHKPLPSELLTPQELDDAAPFYFVLRNYIRQLREAREAAGLTLADLSARTGMAVESLSRLETGAQTNPTWKTLGVYAKALNRRPQLVLETAAVLTQSIHLGEQYVAGTHRGSASTVVPVQTSLLAG